MNDEVFMRECLSLACEAAEAGDVPVGAVVVKNDKVIGRGFNRRELGKSAVSHAEILAIEDACRTLGDWRLDGCTLYVTLEPCPMCAGACLMSRLSRIVYGAKDETVGSFGTAADMSAVYPSMKPEITGGVLEEECAALISSFFSEVRMKPVPKRLKREFYADSADGVAQALLGKILCVKDRTSGDVKRARITETEAYFGDNDSASHAYKGITDRNRPMFDKGGTVYVYLCYGIHSMLNIVTGPKGRAEAVLIRGTEGSGGPGRVTKYFGIDRSFNAQDVVLSADIWIEDDGFFPSSFSKSPRIGIDYAEESDREALLRFTAD